MQGERGIIDTGGGEGKAFRGILIKASFKKLFFRGLIVRVGIEDSGLLTG